MLKKVAIGLVVLLVVLAGIGMLLPRHVHVERSIAIDAPRATVYAVVDGYKSFNKWSPWAQKDPNMKTTLEGPEFGVGAKQSWDGDPKTVGTGSQITTEVKPFETVASEIDFGPRGKAQARFTLVPEGPGTKVTWGLDVDMGSGPIGRYFGLTMDKMIGGDYETGLARLKTYVEGLPKVDFSDLVVEKTVATPVTVAFVPATSTHDDKAIAGAIGAAYMKVGAFMKKNGLKQAGAPITIDTKWDDAGYAFDAGVPVTASSDKKVPEDPVVMMKSTYAGPVLKVIHKGAYSDLSATRGKLAAYVAARSYTPAGPCWEEYVSDPGTTPEADLITNIVQPIK